MKITKQLIFKQNPVIRGHYEDENKDITLPSEFDFDVLNAIYQVTQQSLFATPAKDYNEEYIQKRSFYVSDVKRFLKLKSNKYPQLIKDSLDNLMKIEIVLKNFMNPADGKKYKEFKTHILGSVGYVDSSQNEIVVEFTQFFMVNILRHTAKHSDKFIGNFTTIDAVVTRGIRSKYGKRLYEYLLSFNGKGSKSSLTMNVEELNKLFGTNYTSLAYHNQILKRCYEQVNKNIEFSYKSYKVDKVIVFVVKKP